MFDLHRHVPSVPSVLTRRLLRGTRGAEDVPHRVVPLVARVLEYVRKCGSFRRLSAAVHGRRERRRIRNRHLVADRLASTRLNRSVKRKPPPAPR